MEKNTTITKLRLKKSNKRTKKMRCSPMVAGKSVSKESCYTNDTLLQIRDAYERTHPDQPRIKGSPTQILKELKDRMKAKCETEDCWLELLPKTQREYVDKYVFAPDQPKEWKSNPDEWLSNCDIIKVLKQYEIAYPNFRFLGPSPIDFDKHIKASANSTSTCVEETLCQFSLIKCMEDKKEKIGICFNLDDHEGPGTHWVSLFIDIPNKTMFYFDSALFDTPPEITEFVKRIMKQSDEAGLGIQFDKNTLQHQMSNTECGMYSLFFIITMLTQRWGGNGKKKYTIAQLVRLFKNHRLKDSVVSDFRHKYFNSV
uniref:Ubiquitin-like protease family profile domain-containing protein n=1 Tax=viral metagenome TaxID=1070528 RepID=A0A6C0IDQ2_9ZZZZ